MIGGWNYVKYSICIIFELWGGHDYYIIVQRMIFSFCNYIYIYTYIYIYVYFFIYKDPWEDPMHMGNIYGKYDGFVPFFPACGIHVQL